MSKNIEELKELAKEVRVSIIEMIAAAGTGHPAGSLSSADIFTALYFDILKHEPKNPTWEDRDRLFLSAGHICPAQYSAMSLAGYFPKEELLTYSKLGSPLQGHPERDKLPGIEITSGPLGLGLAQATGYTLAAKMDHKDFYVYCVSSDAEQEEGNHMEAVIIAERQKLSNLILFVDRNKIQVEKTTEEISGLGSLPDKYKAFGWNTLEIDGHDFNQIIDAVRKAKEFKNGPTVIIANTIAGKGVSFMEGKSEWHSKAPNEEETKKALEEIQNG